MGVEGMRSRKSCVSRKAGDLRQLERPGEYLHDLSLLYRRAYRDQPEYADTDAGAARDYLESLCCQCPGGFWVFEDNGLIKGFIILDYRWRDQEGDTIGEIHEIAVDKSCQGWGIGSILLEKALALFRAKKLPRAGIWVGERNFRARRFYARHGFLEGRREGRWRRMVRPL